MSYLPGIEPWAYALLLAVTVFAAIVQRLSGMGFGTVVAPVMAIVAVGYAPAAILILGLSITSVSARMDFRRDQMREIAPMLAGRFLGAIPAALLVGVLAGGDGLGLFIALTILIAVGLSLAGFRAPKTGPNLFAAGAASGFLATISSVGAAPVALIYQHDAAKAARGALNAFFLAGLMFSIAALMARGVVEWRHLWLALALLPGVLAGVAASMPLARFVDGGALKPWALGLSTLAAIGLLIKSLA